MNAYYDECFFSLKAIRTLFIIFLTVAVSFSRHNCPKVFYLSNLPICQIAAKTRAEILNLNLLNEKNNFNGLTDK